MLIPSTHSSHQARPAHVIDINIIRKHGRHDFVDLKTGCEIKTRQHRKYQHGLHYTTNLLTPSSKTNVQSHKNNFNSSRIHVFVLIS